MRKILILHSVYTGHGHKSISTAIYEQLKKRSDVEVEVIDGFALMGKAGVEASKIYGPVTRRAKDLWKFTYTLTNQRSKTMENMITQLIHDRFMRKLAAFSPDLIVSVHGMFTSAVINLLEQYRLDIPFVVLQADIINIHRTWCDPRATLTLCPTQEALTSSLRYGMPADRLRQCGFPTREQFTMTARNSATPKYHPGQEIRLLLMSGGEGSGDMLKYARALLDSTLNCHIRIICGRNKRLRLTLEEALMDDYLGRVDVYGFVSEIEQMMRETDIVIARGSPNTLMEAVVMNVPVIITGSLPGQEADNPALMVAHNLGVVCDEPADIPFVVRRLIRDNGAQLESIRSSQREYRNLDNAKDIADLLYAMSPPIDYCVPPFKEVSPAEIRTRYTLRKLKKTFRRAGKRAKPKE